MFVEVHERARDVYRQGGPGHRRGDGHRRRDRLGVRSRGRCRGPARRRRPGAREDGRRDHRGRRTGTRLRRRRAASRDVGATRVTRLVEEFGGLDILVNNAGVVRYGVLPTLHRGGLGLRPRHQPQGDVPDVALSRFPSCRKRGGGAIINLASVQAYWSHQGPWPTSASKGGVVAFSRALALDHAREGIRVYAIAPGSVLTPMVLDAARRSNPDDPDAALAQFAEHAPDRPPDRAR